MSRAGGSLRKRIQLNDFRKWSVLGLGCAIGLLGFGCSSSDNGSAATASVPLDQLPQRFSSALCDALEPCCKTDQIAYSSSKCKQEATREFTDLVTSNTAIGAAYDPSAAGECLNSMLASLKSCVAIGDGPTSPACQRLFFASFPKGAYCLSDEECASHNCEFGGVELSGRGLCSAFSASSDAPAQLDEPCDGECFAGNDSCPYSVDGVGAYCHASDGLFCATDSQTCIALPAIGDDCSSLPCVTGAYCNADGVCKPRHASGPCIDNIDQACSSDSYCNAPGITAAGECVAKKPDGYACTTNEECKNDKCNLQMICGPGDAATRVTCSGDFLGGSAPTAG